MKNEIRISKDGKTFVSTEPGPKGGTKKLYTARAEGQDQPISRALWCHTKREALEYAGAANVAA